MSVKSSVCVDRRVIPVLKMRPISLFPSSLKVSFSELANSRILVMYVPTNASRSRSYSGVWVSRCIVLVDTPKSRAICVLFLRSTICFSSIWWTRVSLMLCISDIFGHLGVVVRESKTFYSP